MLTALRVGLSTVLIALGCFAQSGKERVFYIAKPDTPGEYRSPMKPLTRLADLKAKHHGQTNWRELVIDDGNSKAYMIQEGPGARYARRLYTDSPAWWAVLEGRIRYEVEKPNGGFETIEASKGSWVFAPERMLHSLQVLGEEPAIRFEVTLYQATPVFEERPQKSLGQTTSYIPVRVSAGPNPLDVPNEDGKPWLSHINVYDLAEENAGKPRWYRPAMRKNRVRSNFICGSPHVEPERAPGYRGHFHADFAEFWVVMLGTLKWTIEGQKEPLIGHQGDIIYAPPKTFHLAQFQGAEGPNCRLTSSTFPSANHIWDADE